MKQAKINCRTNGVFKQMKKYWVLYLMFLPAVLYYVIFAYKPMYGALIAFKDFEPTLGFMESPWVGFKHFIKFFDSYYFWRLIKNTFTISGFTILFGFPAPIILALLMNEIQSSAFKRTVQTITYLPHFISMVVICGMIKIFTGDSGIITDIVVMFGGERTSLLNKAEFFVPIYVISNIWQTVGWGTIIYLAALTGVDQELYEAAAIDGAGRFRQTLSITLPGIAPTIITMLILRLGNILSVGYEKIILLYNPMTYQTADVISSYNYRAGLLESQWSYSTAVGLFNSAINLAFLVLTNKISKSVSETSLW